jgi:hypothetical protein
MTDLDRYLDDFGTQLRVAKPPRRPRRALVFGATLATATAVAIVALLLAPSGGGTRPGPVDAVAAARKALDPAGVILHMRLRIDLPGADVEQTVMETWSAQAPGRWRLVQASKDGEPIELAYAGGEHSDYVRGRLTIERGFTAEDPAARLPSVFSQRGKDPDTNLRALLASGKLLDKGEAQVAGKTVRRLTSKQGMRKLDFDVDPVTFAPLGGRIVYDLPSDSKRPGMDLRFVVEAFERLPITPETEKLLVITPPAGTKTTVRDRREL